MKKIGHGIKSLFLSGFFTLLPIAFTIFALNVTYGFVYRSLEPLRRIEPDFIRNIPGAEFVIATLLIIGLGVLLRLFLVGSIIKYFEELLAKIPFVRAIYSSAKMVVDFFKLSEKNAASRRVVLIQYPRKDNYHLAFLLESAQDSYQKIIPDDKKNHLGENYVKVFMPNSPNPTTGYFFVLPEEEIIHTDITFEEAIKTLVSCGLITPESLLNIETENK